MTEVDRNIEKSLAISDLLRHEHCLVHLDSRKESVILPSHLMKNPSVSLKLSYLFRGGLEVLSSGIKTTLSFSGKPFECYIPFDAIWGATDFIGKSYFWWDDVPELIVEQLKKSVQDSTTKSDKVKKKKKGQATLRRVK